MTAQEQAIRTKAIEAKIDKTQAEIKCGKVDETVRHTVRESPMLAQREYKVAERYIGKYVEKFVLM